MYHQLARAKSERKGRGRATHRLLSRNEKDIHLLAASACLSLSPSLPPSLPPSSLPPSSPRDFFESVNRFCLVKLPTANRARHTTNATGRLRQQEGRQGGRLGHRQEAGQSERGKAKEGGRHGLSLSHSLTVVHCTNFFRPDRTTDRRRIWMPRLGVLRSLPL